MRNDMRAIMWVHCYKGGTLLRSYDFPVPATLNDAAVQLPANASLEAQAKTNLTNEHLAWPPYAEITFKIECQS
jgi:hypothetical protein